MILIQSMIQIEVGNNDPPCISPEKIWLVIMCVV